MYQVFDTAQLLRLGLSEREVRDAALCCLERVARGRFAVRRRCEDERHRRIRESADQGDVTMLTTRNDFRDVIERLKVLVRARADLVNGARRRESGGVPYEVFSHLSAALVWGLVVSRPAEHRVEVIRSATSRRYANLHVRRRDLPVAQVDRNGDIRVTSLPRTLIDVARDYDLDVSVPMLDDALRRELVTETTLHATLADATETRNAKRVLTALDTADPRRESPAESIVAVRFFENMIRGFEPQADIVDRHGRFIARVDFLHKGAKLVVEFDGRAKYFLNDRDHRAAFDQERERERQLRALGYHVVRIFWKDLFRRDAFIDVKRLVAARLP